MFGCLTQVLDQRLRVDFFLNVDRDDGDGEVLAVLLVLAFPDELRIEGGVARVEHRLWRFFLAANEFAELLRRDVDPLVLVLEGFDRLDGRASLLGGGSRGLSGTSAVQDSTQRPFCRIASYMASGARSAPLGQQTAPNSSTKTRWNRSGLRANGSKTVPRISSFPRRTPRSTSPIVPSAKQTRRRLPDRVSTVATRQGTVWRTFNDPQPIAPSFRSRSFFLWKSANASRTRSASERRSLNATVRKNSCCSASMAANRVTGASSFFDSRDGLVIFRSPRISSNRFESTVNLLPWRLLADCHGLHSCAATVKLQIDGLLFVPVHQHGLGVCLEPGARFSRVGHIDFQHCQYVDIQNFPVPPVAPWTAPLGKPPEHRSSELPCHFFCRRCEFFLLHRSAVADRVRVVEHRQRHEDGYECHPGGSAARGYAWSVK